MLQFIDKKFKIDHDATIGVEFGSKTLNIRNKNIKLQIWDTPGLGKPRPITRSFYIGSHGVLLVFDVTSRESFSNISYWMNEIRVNKTDDTKILIVGNKIDLGDKRVVSFEEAKALADSLEVGYVEVSAKMATGVEESFYILTSFIYVG